MKENWFALFICINKEISIDKGLTAMGLRGSGKRGRQGHPRKSKYSTEDVNLIMKLKKEGKRPKEIGELVGLNSNQVWGVIRMYGNKITARTPTKVVQAAY